MMSNKEGLIQAENRWSYVTPAKDSWVVRNFFQTCPDGGIRIHRDDLQQLYRLCIDLGANLPPTVPIWDEFSRCCQTDYSIATTKGSGSFGTYHTSAEGQMLTWIESIDNDHLWNQLETAWGGSRTVNRPTRDSCDVLRNVGFPASVVAAYQSGSTESPAAAEWAASYRGERSPWLWIKGSGSDTVAAQVVATVALRQDMHEIAQSEITCTSALDIAEAYSSAPLFGEGCKSEVLRAYRRTPLLVLARLGTEHADSRTWELFSRLLDSRVDQMLPTIITSASLGGSEWISRFKHVAEHDALAQLAARISWAMGGFAKNRDEMLSAVRRNFVCL